MGFFRRRATECAASLKRGGVLSTPLNLDVPSDSRFSFLESIDYEASYDDGRFVSSGELDRVRAFRYTTWRDDKRRVLYDDDLYGDSNLLPHKDVAYHRATGVTAAVGFGRTEFYADPALHEWLEYLWIKPAGEHAFVRIALPGEAWSTDIAADGGSAGVLSWQGGGYCSLVDSSTCESQVLGIVKSRSGRDLTGGEELRFSPDGAWLVITTPVEPDWITLIEVESGQSLHLACSGVRSAGWWPQHSASSLLVGWVAGAGPAIELGVLDLQIGRVEPLGRLELPAELQDNPQYAYGVERLAVGPDGVSLLGLTYAATVQDWATGRHPKSRVATGRLELGTGSRAGVITSVADAFLDSAGAAALEQRRARWLDTITGAPVGITASLRDQAVAPVIA